MRILLKYTKSVIIAMILISALSIIFIAYLKKDVDISSETYSYAGSKNIECLYYNKTDFMNVKNFEIKHEDGVVRGCIIPHHLLAKDLIHEVFQHVKKYNYKTVVLIGPDHESKDMGKIFTSLNDWQTPMGILKTDKKTSSELLKNSFMAENDEKLVKEHSVSGIIPFIKYYMEDAEVITLVLTKQVKQKDVNVLVEKLCQNINAEETLFIASIDFSHYLELNKADIMDKISIEAIQNEDIKKIMSFTNDNLDSPASLVTILKLMDKLGVQNKSVLNRSNSELILKKRVKETTSYITYLFY